MSHLVGCVAMSHAPQLMLDPGKWHLLRNRLNENLPEKPGLENEIEEVKWRKWRACHAAIDRLRAEVESMRPDVLIVIGDDQHENLVDDAMPPFTIFIGAEAEASASLRYLNQSRSENRTRYGVENAMAEALINGLMERGFDPAYCRRTRYEGGLGHAFARVLKFLLPEANCHIIPVMVNTYYPPAPSAARCLDFGKALGALVRDYPRDYRVMIAASGGLSHTKIDEPLDADFLRALACNDTAFMGAMPQSVFREGTSEILNWIAVAGAADRGGNLIDYIPLYRTRTGIGCAMGFAAWDLSP
jgi:3-O-methylgallate 3,4-dioxygenase